jgi:tRNA 5-methylaminomethyl-2-thiouridine biosynthesis bifunctional protein
MANIVPRQHCPHTTRIVPAELALDANGTPCSPVFGDVYHSAESGPGQARHVFIAGNALPQRWAQTRVFTILETGFGLGLNFLETWGSWQADPARCERLHFVSVEKHPFEIDALRQLHTRYPELAPVAAQLQNAWPPLVPGLHRLHFEAGRVTLTLAFGDAVAMLPRLRVIADAIYLDGFAPDRNDDMWSPHVMKALSRLSRPGTTFATWSTAAAVREHLATAGFSVEKRPGFGRKREMLAGRFAPRWPVGRTGPGRFSSGGAESPRMDRHAIVIGGGLAGAAVCERLSARGWRVDLIEGEAAATLSRKASAFAGVFHPHVSSDDCILSRVVRSGYLYGVRRWQALESAGHRLDWSRCGVLQFDEDPEEGATQYPRAYAERVTRDRAAALTGVRPRSGGWWFPGGGWVRPSSLVAAQLAAASPFHSPLSLRERVRVREGASNASPTLRYNTTVDQIARERNEWHALAADGGVIASAPVLILANSSDATRLAPLSQSLARVRGQVTYVPAEALDGPRAVITGGGHVLPAIDGVVVTGSTYDRDDDPAPQIRGHEANLMRLANLLPDARLALDAAKLAGVVGFRAVAPDRLPLVGPVPDVEETRTRKDELAGAHLRDLPRVAGLYCITGFASRGLVWSALAGELIASMLEGEPLPLESDLADAIDPARFVLRQLRSGSL